MRRRTFFGVGLSAAVAASLAGCSKRGGGAYWRFFTDDEARTMDAICAQLIPADRDPGAAEAHAVVYIDTQLARRFRKHQKTYRQGLAAVEAASQRLFTHRFAELSGLQSIQVLKDIEQNSHDFFELALAHTRQGFYGDPRHGGNYRMASWKMVRLPFPQVRGRQHYEG